VEVIEVLVFIGKVEAQCLAEAFLLQAGDPEV
jgi:hypothetical protein